MFAIVEADDAGVVHHFDHDRDMVRALHNLGMVVIGAIRKHRRAAIAPKGNATLGKTPVLGVFRILIDIRTAQNVAVFTDVEADAKSGRLTQRWSPASARRRAVPSISATS